MRMRTEPECASKTAGRTCLIPGAACRSHRPSEGSRAPVAPGSGSWDWRRIAATQEIDRPNHCENQPAQNTKLDHRRIEHALQFRRRFGSVSYTTVHFPGSCTLRARLKVSDL